MCQNLSGTKELLVKTALRSSWNSKPYPYLSFHRLWLEMTHTRTASRLRRELMIPLLAYKTQEAIYGGLPANICRELCEISESLRRGDKVQTSTHRRFQPGTRLIRHWKDETHEVTLQTDGYEYRGEHFANLSEIARKITGTRWSGPAFFGTKPTVKRKPKA
ncbi:MAG: DUF2924 domain-containing protein [Acidobacteriaceae bacterium]